MFRERFLYRVQPTVARQPFNGQNSFSIRLDREERTGFGAQTVHDNRTSAAARGVAAEVRTGQPHPVA
jgi:hypothetical protein